LIALFLSLVFGGSCDVFVPCCSWSGFVKVRFLLALVFCFVGLAAVLVAGSTFFFIFGRCVASFLLRLEPVPV
jgi:hypothetical protein